MMLLLRWALNTLALMVVPEVVTSIHVDTWLTALVAAVVLGLINALIRPVLLLLTLPITVLTLGFFALVVNALLFWAVSGLVPGFDVAGFWSALWGALLYSVLTWLVNLALADRSPASPRITIRRL